MKKKKETNWDFIYAMIGVGILWVLIINLFINR